MTAILISVGTILLIAPAAPAEEKRLLQYERRVGLFGKEYRAGFLVGLDRGIRLRGQVGSGLKEYNWRLQLGPGGIQFGTGRQDVPDQRPMPAPGAQEV